MSRGGPSLCPQEALPRCLEVSPHADGSGHLGQTLTPPQPGPDPRPPAPLAKWVPAEGEAEGGRGRTAPHPCLPPNSIPAGRGEGAHSCGVPAPVCRQQEPQPAAPASSVSGWSPPGQPLGGGARSLAGVPAPPVMSPPGRARRACLAWGRHPPPGLSCTGTSRKHTAWARRARLRDGGSVSAPHRTVCSQRKLTASPPRLRRAAARAGPLPTGLPPEPLLTPRPSPPRPSRGVRACSHLRQARVHGLRQGLESGPGRSFSEEPWGGSLLLSLSFLIHQMGRTRSLQRSQVCVKAVQPSAGACAPSAMPFNTPVAPVGFSSSPARAKLAPPSPHPKTVAGRRAFPTELHPSSADPVAPRGCSCRAGRPLLRFPRSLGALPAAELSPRGDSLY